MNDEELDRRLAPVDRPPQVSAAVLDSLARAAHIEGTKARRRRLWGLGVASMLVVVGGAVSAPAAADVARHFLAQATWFEASGTEVIPGSEWVDLSSDDLGEYIEYIYPDDIPLAPSMTRDEVLVRTYEVWRGSDGLSQEVGIRHTVELIAYCGWTIEMVDADYSWDEGRYDRAVDKLFEAAEWPATVATDGGGIVDQMLVMAEAAEDHQEGSKYDLFRMGECAELGFDLEDIQ